MGRDSLVDALLYPSKDGSSQMRSGPPKRSSPTRVGPERSRAAGSEGDSRRVTMELKEAERLPNNNAERSRSALNPPPPGCVGSHTK